MGHTFPGYSLYEDLADKNKHKSAMKMLCEKFPVQPTVMQQVYEAILIDLKTRARVQQYLSIFVVRTIQNLIGNPTPPPSLSELDRQQAEELRKMLLESRKNNEKAEAPGLSKGTGTQAGKEFRKTSGGNIDGSSTIGLQ